MQSRPTNPMRASARVLDATPGSSLRGLTGAAGGTRSAFRLATTMRARA